MFIREEIVAYVNYLKRMRSVLKGQLRRLPEGDIVIKKAKGKNYYYIKEGEQLRSLNRDKRKDDFIERMFIEKRLRAIEHNIPVMETAAKRLKPVIESDSIWEGFTDESGDFLQEEKRHLYKGKYYRSKSEVIIAQMLISYGIEFKYEAALKHNGRVFYPDFVIRRSDGRVVIWEHFGLMENQGYRSKAYEKIEMYYHEGFCLWDNFIASFDETGGSINMDYVEKLIRLYLL